MAKGWLQRSVKSMRKPAALGDHAAKAPDAAFMTGQGLLMQEDQG
jgi:hypothetical protein